MAKQLYIKDANDLRRIELRIIQLYAAFQDVKAAEEAFHSAAPEERIAAHSELHDRRLEMQYAVELLTGWLVDADRIAKPTV